MFEGLSKQSLLEALHAERLAWEALLAEVGPARMEDTGVTGDWTMKDTIAHLTTWWRREVAILAAAQRGEVPPPHPPQSEVAVINQWVYLTNRDRPLEDILRDAAEAWEQFESLLWTFPEEELSNPDHFAWTEGRALGAEKLLDFVGHLHEEHEPLIRQWLKQT